MPGRGGQRADAGGVRYREDRHRRRLPGADVPARLLHEGADLGSVDREELRRMPQAPRIHGQRRDRLRPALGRKPSAPPRARA